MQNKVSWLDIPCGRVSLQVSCTASPKNRFWSCRWLRHQTVRCPMLTALMKISVTAAEQQHGRWVGHWESFWTGAVPEQTAQTGNIHCIHFMHSHGQSHCGRHLSHVDTERERLCMRCQKRAQKPCVSNGGKGNDWFPRLAKAFGHTQTLGTHTEEAGETLRPRNRCFAPRKVRL